MPIYANISTKKFWEDFRDDVRSGNIESMYNTGNIVYDNCDPETGTAFQIVGINDHFDTTMYQQGYTHSVTLCQYKLDIRQFSPIDAFIYLEKAMSPGTYSFTLENSYSYYFTTTTEVPIGGQLVLEWSFGSPTKVSSYASSTDTIPLDSDLKVTKYSGTSPEATFIGTILISNIGASEYGILNCWNRSKCGSSNYAQSGLRQFLNTANTGNTWWEPKTVFNRPHANRDLNGYLSTLNQDFVNVLANPSINYLTSSFEYPSIDGTTFPVNSTYTLTDKVFLLSHTEIGFTKTPTLGSIISYYYFMKYIKGYTRIKYIKDSENPNSWWTRTCESTYYLNVVNSSGTAASLNAYADCGVAPAVVIQ